MGASWEAGIVKWINGSEDDSPNLFAELLFWLIVPIGEIVGIILW